MLSKAYQICICVHYEEYIFFSLSLAPWIYACEFSCRSCNNSCRLYLRLWSWNIKQNWIRLLCLNALFSFCFFFERVNINIYILKKKSEMGNDIFDYKIRNFFLLEIMKKEKKIFYYCLFELKFRFILYYEFVFFLGSNGNYEMQKWWNIEEKGECCNWALNRTKHD